MRPPCLTNAEITSLRETLPEWQVSDDLTSLLIAYKFSDFQQAFAFMSEVAEAAEAIDHHPDWRNSYARVNIRLTTHDVGGLTSLDEDLASKISQLAKRFKARCEATS